MEAQFVLVHSPLVGPLTWQPVARQLRERGIAAAVPALRDNEGSTLPYWQQHADSVAGDLRDQPDEVPLVLVAHSGAGALLPTIHQRLARPVRACIFADAGLPHPGQSRLDEWASTSPDLAAQLRALLAVGGRYPTWTADDLRDLIPDEALRRGVVAELRPRGLDFFTERFPDTPNWADLPSAYLQFGAAYDRPAEQARQRGWPNCAIAAGHFHQLVDPVAVADALIALAGELAARHGA